MDSLKYDYCGLKTVKFHWDFYSASHTHTQIHLYICVEYSVQSNSKPWQKTRISDIADKERRVHLALSTFGSFTAHINNLTERSNPEGLIDNTSRTEYIKSHLSSKPIFLLQSLSNFRIIVNYFFYCKFLCPDG